jgi:hypothetical protein
MKNYTPIDIESILGYGIDRWYEEFDWPISWQEFLDIENKCKKVLNDHIEKYPDFADLILINYKVFIEYSNLIYALYVLKNIKNEPLISKGNPYFYNLFHNGLPDKPIINFPNLDKEHSILKKYIRFLKLFLKDNKFHFPKFFSPKKYIFKESRSGNTLKYLQRNYLGSIYSLSFFDIYEKGLDVEMDGNQKNKLLLLVSSIANGINDVAKDYRLKLTDMQRSFLKKTTRELFTKSYMALVNIQAGLKNKKYELFIGANNCHFSRIVSVAIRNAGGHIHGFTHGEPIVYDWDKISWMELSLNDYFYEYNEYVANRQREVNRNNLQFRNQSCQIKSINLPQYENFFSLKTHSNKRLKKIMLIGNFFLDYGYSEVGAPFSVIQLYIEQTLIRELQSIDCDVIYKIHPENIIMQEHAKSFFVDTEISAKRFEDVSDIPDAFLFYYTRTTVFGQALATEKPIIVVDAGWESIENDLDVLLKKRCQFVSSNFNNKNALEIDKDELVKALS